MASTSSRMLKLLSLLQTHRYWPGADLADRLEVSPRTLRRDIDRLRELGYPVEAQRGLEGGYQLAAGAALPPLVLDDDEAVALAIGLRAAAQGAVSGIEDASVRALAKVVQVMPPTLRRRVDALGSATMLGLWPGNAVLDAEVLTTLAQSCRDEERVRFSYTAADGQKTTRHVEPLRLVSLGRRWYLVAYDLLRQDWRTFRLDRLSSVRSTGMRFHPRQLPAADAAAFVRASIGSMRESQPLIEAEVFASEADVKSIIGRFAVVEPLGDAGNGKRCRVRMHVDHLDWAIFTLGMVRSEFKVVGPPELVEQLQEWSTRFARALR
jgi:predicted DNA-binding transcriptional regulator YafY